MDKYFYHHHVSKALENEGWTITHDPYYLYFSEKRVMVDLGGEKLIVAKKEKEKIAVEVKSFTGISLIHQLHQSVGQFDFYALLLNKQEPERVLYLAMPQDAYDELIVIPVIKEFLERRQVKLITFDINEPKLKQWIK